MSDNEAPNWIEALSAALPGTDRRAIEGWAVWFKTLWSDSDRALTLLQEASRPDGLTGGLDALLRHLNQMRRHVPEVEAHLQRLHGEIKGSPYREPAAGAVDGQTAELQVALHLLAGTLDDFEGGDRNVRTDLRDQLDEAIRLAAALRAKLDEP